MNARLFAIYIHETISFLASVMIVIVTSINNTHSWPFSVNGPMYGQLHTAVGVDSSKTCWLSTSKGWRRDLRCLFRKRLVLHRNVRVGLYKGTLWNTSKLVSQRWDKLLFIAFPSIHRFNHNNTTDLFSGRPNYRTNEIYHCFSCGYIHAHNNVLSDLLYIYFMDICTTIQPWLTYFIFKR